MNTRVYFKNKTFIYRKAKENRHLGYSRSRGRRNTWPWNLSPLWATKWGSAQQATKAKLKCTWAPSAGDRPWARRHILVCLSPQLHLLSSATLPWLWQHGHMHMLLSSLSWLSPAHLARLRAIHWTDCHSLGSVLGLCKMVLHRDCPFHPPQTWDAL